MVLLDRGFRFADRSHPEAKKNSRITKILQIQKNVA
jgi:hypothetical protein